MAFGMPDQFNDPFAPWNRPGPHPVDPNRVPRSPGFTPTTASPYNSNLSPLDMQSQTLFSPAAGGSMQQLPQFRGQQQDFISMLRQRASGQGGPSPAEMLLQQALGRNQQAAASAIGSQRGINPALQARQILDAQAQQSQMMAGQGATLRAQEQLSAQGMLGQALQGARGQDIGQALGYGGLENQQTGIAAAASGADTGNVMKLAGGIASGLGGAASQWATGGSGMSIGDAGKAAFMGASSGGAIPGRAEAQGDTMRNDTVPAMLSPGEIVLPRSVTQAADAPQRARDFVIALQRSKNKGPHKYFDRGGEADPDDALLYAAKPEMQPAAPTSVDAPQTRSSVMEAELAAQPAHIPPLSATTMALPPVPAPVPKPAGEFPPTTEMRAGEKQQIKGMEGEAKAKQEFGHEHSDLMDSYTLERQALYEKWQKDHEALTAQTAKLRDDILNSKIDPNRLWSNAGTGQKIAASIGMILGGIGAGLTGGPNYALEVINRAIDRDVEAQKLELHKKHTVMGNLMQQGRDLHQSALLAGAQLREQVAAQLEAASANYVGTAAAPAAQAAIGALRQGAFMQQEQAKSMQWQNLSTALDYKYKQTLQQRLSGGQGSAGLSHDLLMGSFYQHPEKLAEHQVDAIEEAPTGAKDQAGNPLSEMRTRSYLGKSAQDREKATEALGKNRIMEVSLKELESFLQKHPAGDFMSEDVGKVKAAAANLKANYEAAMAGMNRQASPEVVSLMDSIVKDPSDIFKSTAKYKGATQFLRKMINEHRRDTLALHTLGPL